MPTNADVLELTLDGATDAVQRAPRSNGFRRVTLTGILAWHGRKLKCNGVTVAQIVDVDQQRWRFRLGMSRGASREYLKEENARRAINRQFCLPDDFGPRASMKLG
jgi:hypothetical protein